jgi:acyl-ACP thioesterase
MKKLTKEELNTIKKVIADKKSLFIYFKKENGELVKRYGTFTFPNETRKPSKVEDDMIIYFDNTVGNYRTIVPENLIYCRANELELYRKDI